MGYQYVIASGIHGEMAWAGVTRWLLVKLLEFTVFPVQSERRDAPALFALEIADFIYGVKEFAIGMNLEERRIAQTADSAQFSVSLLSD